MLQPPARQKRDPLVEPLPSRRIHACRRPSSHAPAGHRSTRPCCELSRFHPPGRRGQEGTGADFQAGTNQVHGPAREREGETTAGQAGAPESCRRRLRRPEGARVRANPFSLLLTARESGQTIRGGGPRAEVAMRARLPRLRRSSQSCRSDRRPHFPRGCTWAGLAAGQPMLACCLGAESPPPSQSLSREALP